MAKRSLCSRICPFAAAVEELKLERNCPGHLLEMLMEVCIPDFVHRLKHKIACGPAKPACPLPPFGKKKKKGVFTLIHRTPARLLPASLSSASSFQGLENPQDSGEEELLHLQALSAAEVRRGKALEGCTPRSRAGWF